jgi:hypothetical protein
MGLIPDCIQTSHWTISQYCEESKGKERRWVGVVYLDEVWHDGATFEDAEFGGFVRRGAASGGGYVDDCGDIVLFNLASTSIVLAPGERSCTRLVSGGTNRGLIERRHKLGCGVGHWVRLPSHPLC